MSHTHTRARARAIQRAAVRVCVCVPGGELGLSWGRLGVTRSRDVFGARRFFENWRARSTLKPRPFPCGGPVGRFTIVYFASRFLFSSFFPKNETRDYFYFAFILFARKSIRTQYYYYRTTYVYGTCCALSTIAVVHGE